MMKMTITRAWGSMAMALLLVACSAEKNQQPLVDGFVAEVGDAFQQSGRDTARALDARPLGSDGWAPLAGQGTLSGECGVLDDSEWNANEPFLFRNVLDFGAQEFDQAQLSAGGKQILAEGNLNVGSLYSEIFAFEVLHRCELAQLLKTESKVSYVDPDGKKTDLLVEVDGRKIGVSVTRALHYPAENPYTAAEAQDLLNTKLAEVQISEKNAKDPDRWERSLLHVMAYNQQYADVVQTVYGQLDAATRARTIMVVTVTEGNDYHLY
jgi:hypothetical protein